MSESETGREAILAVGAACGEPVRKALMELLDIFEGQVKRQHAHELAEKIRNEPSPRDSDDYCGLVDQGADWAADLIDPGVSSDG